MTGREPSVRLLRARHRRRGNWIRLAPDEWAAARRQAAFSGFEPRDYVGSLIVGGRVIPISILEDQIRRGQR